MNSDQATISHETNDGILTVEVEGWITISEIAAYARSHIDTWSRSPRLLWDLRQMDFF